MVASGEMMRLAMRQMLVLLGCLSVPGAFAAQSEELADRSITLFELGYSVRQWRGDEGLPSRSVRSLQSGPDGRLWIGTNAGVARFDGFKFTHLTPTFPKEARLHEITDMLIEPSGKRWTVGRNGPQVLWDGDRFQSFRSDEGAKPGFWAITNGPDGGLWAARADLKAPRIEILRFAGDRFEQVTKPIPGGYPRTLAFDREGQLWGTLSQITFPSGSTLFRVVGNRTEPVAIAREKGQQVVLFHRNDGTLALAGSQGIYRREGDHWVLEQRFPIPLPSRSGLMECVEDERGNFWLTTFQRGLWVYRPGKSCDRVVADSFEFPSICRALFIDPSGSIWIGTASGLFQLYRTPFLRAPASELIRHHQIRDIGEDAEGTLWFTGRDRVYYQRPGSPMIGLEEPSLISAKKLITGSRKGAGAWLTYLDGQLYKQQVDGRTRASQIPAKRKNAFRNVVETTSDVWVARAKGLYRLRDGELVLEQPEGIPSGTGATAIADGNDGSLYAGFAGKGLFRYDNGTWENLVAGETISVIALDPDGGVWARVGSGKLGWLSGSSWRTISLAKMELPGPGNFAMICPEDGGLWIQTPDNGVVRFDRKELEQSLASGAQGKVQRERFRLADGLPSEYSMALPSSLFEDSQKRIWVATNRGAAAHDPSYWDRGDSDEQALPLIIESASVDGVPQEVSPSEPVIIPPDAHRLELHYVGIDLTNPEKVSYRYRLAGYDEDWIDAGGRRTADYKGLPPGNYRFQVIGADRNGIWNEEGASLAVIVEPEWFETTMFRIAAPTLAVLVLVSAFYFRIRTLNERARLKEEFSRSLIETQEGERQRLAHELHDSLGQEMLVLKGRLDLAAMKNPESGEQFKQLSSAFSGTIERARALSHELRPPHIDKLGLSKSLRALAGDVQSASAFDVAAEIDELEPRLDGTCELGFFRIAQEAVSNVLKHAEASRLELQLGERNGTVTLVIRDDGRGFDQRISASKRSLGLSGMSERAQLFGGSFECKSSPGKGTQVNVRLKRPTNPST